MSAFVHALYEIQRGYNLNDKGQDDKNSKDYSICYGGTANKFCERLQGLSPIIRFIFINEGTIFLKINSILLQLTLDSCQSLLEKANSGSLEDKERFCTFIRDLQDSEKATLVFTSLFSKETLRKLLTEEFKAQILLVGTLDIEKALNSFEESVLPYLRAISIESTVADSFYNTEFKKKFKVFDDARNAFIASVRSTIPSSDVRALSQFGLMPASSPQTTGEQVMNAIP